MRNDNNVQEVSCTKTQSKEETAFIENISGHSKEIVSYLDFMINTFIQMHLRKPEQTRWLSLKVRNIQIVIFIVINFMIFLKNMQQLTDFWSSGRRYNFTLLKVQHQRYCHLVVFDPLYRITYLNCI